MRIVRIVLQLLIAVFFLAVLGGSLHSPITPIAIGNLVGISLFLATLFVATFSLGKQKESRLVLGYIVNPKVLGLMMGLGGFLMFYFSWRIISGQPMGSDVRGQALAHFIRDYGRWTPAAILIMLGLALGWHGYRMYRGRYGLKISGITPAQVDNAYIQKVGMFGGVLITFVGALVTALFLYIALAQDEENGLPLFLLVPTIVIPLTLVYVGIRILIGKQSN
jgi:hypothetical protein